MNDYANEMEARRRAEVAKVLKRLLEPKLGVSDDFRREVAKVACAADFSQAWEHASLTVDEILQAWAMVEIVRENYFVAPDELGDLH